MGGPGRLDVHGFADLAGGVRLVTNAAVNIFNGGEVFAGSNSFISADWGTTTTINAGGTLEINGSGGYYQGSVVAGQPLGKLVNNGLLSKTGGGTTSIVEGEYVQGASGQVHVDCCALLSFAAGGPSCSGDRYNPAWAWARARAARNTSRSAAAPTARWSTR